MKKKQTGRDRTTNHLLWSIYFECEKIELITVNIYFFKFCFPATYSYPLLWMTHVNNAHLLTQGSQFQGFHFHLTCIFSSQNYYEICSKKATWRKRFAEVNKKVEKLTNMGLKIKVSSLINSLFPIKISKCCVSNNHSGTCTKLKEYSHILRQDGLWTPWRRRPGSSLRPSDPWWTSWTWSNTGRPCGDLKQRDLSDILFVA